MLYILQQNKKNIKTLFEYLSSKTELVLGIKQQKASSIWKWLSFILFFPQFFLLWII